jgi:hypothetical protein
MNWIKAILAGVVGGIVVNIYDFLMHGYVMASTYEKFPIFDVEPANPVWFFVVAVMMGIFGAVLFARTRSAWPAGVKGGATFGFFLGLVAYFAGFYNPLVLNGFPYYLAWCWGGINLIGWVIFGVVAGAIYKGQN